MRHLSGLCVLGPVNKALDGEGLRSARIGPISAQQVSSFPANSCLCAAAKLLPRVGYKCVQRQLPPQGFPFIIMQIGRVKKKMNYSFTLRQTWMA